MSPEVQNQRTVPETARSPWVDSTITTTSDLRGVVDYLHDLAKRGIWLESQDYLKEIPATKQLAITAYWAQQHPEDNEFIRNSMSSLNRSSAYRAVSDTLRRIGSEGGNTDNKLVDLYNQPIAAPRNPLSAFRGFTTDEGFPINIAMTGPDWIGGTLMATRPAEAPSVRQNKQDANSVEIIENPKESLVKADPKLMEKLNATRKEKEAYVELLKLKFPTI